MRTMSLDNSLDDLELMLQVLEVLLILNVFLFNHGKYFHKMIHVKQVHTSAIARILIVPSIAAFSGGNAAAGPLSASSVILNPA